MKLYHGTSERHLAAILKEGLKPRGNGNGGNWKEHPSSPYHVYLTNCYAGYFACAASEKGEKWVVLEVEVDEDELHPDEDFLEACSRGAAKEDAKIIGGTDMKTRTAYYRNNLWDFDHLWEESLNYLGNATYPNTIPPEAITRYVTIDITAEDRSSLLWTIIDPCISPMNYKFCGDKYKALTKWLFGDECDTDEISGPLPDPAMLERAAAEAGKRGGIEVVTLNH